MKVLPFISIVVLFGIISSAGCSSGSGMAGKPAVVVRLDADTASLAASGVSRYVTPASAALAYDAFGPDVRRVFPDLEVAAAAYGEAAERARSLLPDVDFPDTVFTIISPYRQSVVLVEGQVYAALNHFLGPDFEGYASFPAAIRATKTPERLPVEIAEAVIRSHAAGEVPDGTLVAAMMHEGAVYYVLRQLFPDADEATILGFSSDDMRWLRDNEQALWRQLVESDQLFSRDPVVQSRLLESAAEVGAAGAPPARAARYTGYRMACALMDREPQLSASELLSAELATSADLLQRVRYAP